MTKTRTRTRGWLTSGWGHWIPPIAWMGLIFFLSSCADYPNLMPDRPDLQNVLGHITEYATLACLLARAVDHLPRIKHAHLWTIGVVILYAASDEWHQTFIPGRHGDPLDWLVDVAAALLLLSLRHWWTRSRRRPGQPPALTESGSRRKARFVQQ